jgi:hypothetical protein
MKQILIGFFLIACLPIFGQSEKPVVFGNVTDLETGLVVEFATVYIQNTNVATESAIDGSYRIEIEPNKKQRLVVSRLGYNTASTLITEMAPGSKRYVNIKLAPQESDIEIIVTESRIEDVGMVKEEVAELIKLPTASGNLESVLPSIALGVSSGTGGELSSQYTVRGGNYDENLVYVNDFEIFRPQLIRSGQQEGLSFPNIDLVRDLSFSSGGFQAKYGDKLSSVLDIKYKRPEKTKGSLSTSLLGASAHIEGSKRLGANAYNKFRYLIGARYKTSKYILGSLDTKGEYLPTFTDIQAYLTYDISRTLQVGVLGNYNRSIYEFTPTTRSTTLGLITQALRFTSVFEGGEKDRFINGTTGVAFTYVPERDKNPLYLKLLASNYQSNEEENFDILGFYRLAEIETDLGSDDFGTEVAVLGVGTQQQYVRNYLFNRIYNIAHKGGFELQTDSDAVTSHFFQWGIKYQNEYFDDRLNEWERIDSAGFSLPINPEELQLSSFLKTENEIRSNRFSGYIQDSYSYLDEDVREMKLTVGVRGNYRDLNKEFVLSPRAQFLYKPLNWNRDISFKLSGGLYYQPPIYREMRRLDGSVNLELKSQKSTHFVGGMSYDFYWKSMSAKPFRLITEVYYKTMSNLVSYDIDNVRIRYSGENDAEGYATGLDIRLNGEFVPGAESWINLSFLSTKENILDVDHLKYNLEDPENPIVRSSVPRPTDRFMQMSMFFQDYLPNNENFKMHLNLSVGSGLPFGIKDDNRIYRNTFRFKPYHRVDIGFGYQLWKDDWKDKKPHHPFKFSRNSWLSVEVFNLLEVSNVASNTWIKTVTDQQFAIPNFLTSRRINLRLRVDI